MTPALKTESLADDFVVFAIAAQGFNAEGRLRSSKVLRHREEIQSQLRRHEDGQ